MIRNEWNMVRKSWLIKIVILLIWQLYFKNNRVFIVLVFNKSPGIDQIPAKLIKEGGRTICYQIHKLIVSIWNKEELPEEWKESITVPIHKKGDKTDCNNYRGISLLPTTYKILSNILLSRLTPYAEEITGDHQCGFRCNRSTTDHIFCIRQMLEKTGNTMKQCISSL